MTGPAWVALGLFGALAAGDWVAVGTGRRPAEYVLKPATLLALVIVAVALDPADAATRTWFVAALAFSLLGDVFLMLPGDRFVAGLASFLAAHVAYIVGLNRDGGSAAALAGAGAGVAVVAVPLGLRIVRGARRRDTRLGPPVTLYVAVISAMLASALAAGSAWAVGGAALFYISDALIGWRRFVRVLPGHRVAITVTYHLGQAGLVASLLT